MEIATTIIPTRNRIDELRGLLASLGQQTRTDFEVLVMDDGSSQPVSAAVSTQAWPFKLRIKRNEASKGPAAAPNAGLLLARTGSLLFTDDDCRPEPHWVTRLAAALAAAPGEVGGIGGRTIAEGNDLFSRYYDFHRMLDPLPHVPSLVLRPAPAR
jgi:glycosyltransferase involved in cell wall biosynthesis